MRVLIAGCGYVGEALAARLEARGDEVWRLRRRASAAPRSLCADVTRPETLAALPAGLDALVYAVSADAHTVEAYERAYVEGPRNLVAAAVCAGGAAAGAGGTGASGAVAGGAGAGGAGAGGAGASGADGAGPGSDASSGSGSGSPTRAGGGRGPRFVLVSSTGVYGHRAGELVDEDTDPAAGGPLTPTGERLLAGERAVLGGPLPATVLRLAGIYGPGRESRIDAVLAGRARKPRADVWTNRIHRDDAAGALEHLLDLAQPRELYLGVDEDPSTLATFLDWLGARLGIAVPEDDDDATLRARGSKRCDGQRLRASGYRFRYPTFREGYEELCRARGL